MRTGRQTENEPVDQGGDAGTRLAGGSTPNQWEAWSDGQASYRLIDCNNISFAAITAPHDERTRRIGDAGKTDFLLNDTTEINYGGTRKAAGLGKVARNQGKGFFLHSAFMRDPATQQVIGLAGQKILDRKGKKKKGAKNSRRRDANRESIVWGQLIDQVGSPPPDVTWLHVCDRGADDDEVFCRAHRNQCGCVMRACRLNRLILTSAAAQSTLQVV